MLTCLLLCLSLRQLARTLLKLASSVRALLKPYGDRSGSIISVLVYRSIVAFCGSGTLKTLYNTGNDTLFDLVSHKNINDRNTQQPGGIGILSYTFEHWKVAPKEQYCFD